LIMPKRTRSVALVHWWQHNTLLSTTPSSRQTEYGFCASLEIATAGVNSSCLHLLTTSIARVQQNRSMAARLRRIQGRSTWPWSSLVSLLTVQRQTDPTRAKRPTRPTMWSACSATRQPKQTRIGRPTTFGLQHSVWVSLGTPRNDANEPRT
jgi:hypothetical protein